MLNKVLPWLKARQKPDKHRLDIIRGKKVIIRPKRIDDALDDYAWRTDEELSVLDATRPLNMPYDEFLTFARNELIYSRSDSKKLAIDDLSGTHIGNCMFYDIDLKRCKTELGIMIGNRAYWSRGYGTDSVRALLAYIFETTDIRLVYLHTLEWNHRARKAFAKTGMREIKDVRRGGLDFVRMEIEKVEWEKLTYTDEQM